MEVITVSSDSEASGGEADVTIINSSHPCSANWTENYGIDWNDEDARPAIDYNYHSPKNEIYKQLNHEEEIENFISPLKFTNKDKTVSEIVSHNEKSESSKKPGKTCSLISAPSSDTFSQNNDHESNKTKQRQKLSQEDKEKEKMLREQRKLEKEKLKEEKKAERQRQKALKAAFVENQRNLKPEENIKFFTVHIDNEIINSVFGGNIISTLQENNIHYVVESQRKNFTITWSKKRVTKFIGSFGEITENVEVSEENILLYVLGWEKAVDLIHKNELLSHAEVIKSAYVDKKLILVVYGMGKYFSYQKNKRNNEIKAMVSDTKKSKVKNRERTYEEVPVLTKDQLEFAVTDLQLFGQHNCRFLETPHEFASLIHNITKSLSQIDFKLEKQKRQKSDFTWIPIDSHQSVKIDKNGTGLLRLWQQQICQFNAVGLETAQAIVSQYNSPLALVNTYKSIGNSKEAELLLQNIQIRREAGIFSTSRRVGPQLSKKIYNFFTTDEPDLEL